VPALKDTVQRNCDIADAQHGGDYTLCVYLMKMREYFRWEAGLPFNARLPKDEVGDWLTARESLWESLEQEAYASLSIGGADFDPFDAEGINGVLVGSELVYSSGLGQKGRPHFFLGTLDRVEEREGFRVLISGTELARDLTSPPAMMRQSTVYLRRESLRRLLWEKLESWRWSRPDNALGRAFACYDFENRLNQSLDRMTENELGTLLLHEIGEFRAGQQLGPAWEEMLLACLHTPAELMMRAVRDFLADCTETLPGLAERGRPESVHFFVGNLSNMRKAIFPSLHRAYQDWTSSRDSRILERVAALGREHWGAVALGLLELHASHGDQVADAARLWVEQHTL